jgi:diaminopimelate decarboxylase
LTEILRACGGAPAYVYSRELIDRRIRRLRNVLPRQVHLHYAVKANPMPAVVKHITSQVDGLDVASAGELRLALNSGMAAESISFAGPAKTHSELETAVNEGILVNVESRSELIRLVTIGRRHGVRPKISLRVNPDFELKSSGMKMGGGPKQFGIDAEQIPGVLRYLADLDLEFCGFHVFSGSQNLNSAAIVDAQEKTIALVVELAQVAPSIPTVINIGGGFGIPYFPGDKPLDIGPIGQHLEHLCDVAARALPGARLILELGRYIIGEAGIYVCEVIDRKVSRGRVFLATNGGLHQHLAASGNFGQVFRKNYPTLVGNRVYGEQRELATVVGPLCTPLDVLAENVELARAGEGDLIVIFQSGAYGLTASPVNFLSHPMPVEILV